MPAFLRDEKGAALITALMLTTLSLVIATALIYSVLLGAHVSGTQKRYRSVVAATQGGAEAIAQEILPYLIAQADMTPSVATPLESHFSNVELNIGATTETCLAQKVTQPTRAWSGTCNQSPNALDHPDFTFKLKGDRASGFTISTKIVDTVPGNSDRYAIPLLDAGTSVAGNEEGVRPLHVPALYSISVSGQREDNSREKARLSVLYSY